MMTLSIGDDAKQIGGRAQPNPPLSIRCADPITSFDSSLLLAVDDVMRLFRSIPSDWRLPVSRFTHCRAINTFTKKKRRQGEEEETAHSFRLLLCVRSQSHAAPSDHLAGQRQAYDQVTECQQDYRTARVGWRRMILRGGG